MWNKKTFPKENVQIFEDFFHIENLHKKTTFWLYLFPTITYDTNQLTYPIFTPYQPHYLYHPMSG